MNRLPELPADAVAEYWQLVRAALMAGGMSKAEATAAAKAYRAFMKPAGWALYNTDPDESAKYAVKYASWRRKEQGQSATNPKVAPKRKKKPTKNADRLLTLTEIADLPKWACVAFAARCARRVSPLFQKFWPDTPSNHVDAIQYAIVSTEGHAATSDRDDDALDSRVQDLTLGAAYAATRAANTEAVTVAYSVADAVDSARAAASNTDVGVAAATARVASIQWIKPFTRSDFQLVLGESRLRSWTNASPVPPAVFGPLWPDGPPADWPELPKPTKLKLSVQVPDNLDDAVVREKLQKLTTALAQLNVVGGGHGMKLIPPVEFTHEQEKGRADVVREEDETPKGRGNARRGR